MKGCNTEKHSTVIVIFETLTYCNFCNFNFKFIYRQSERNSSEILHERTDERTVGIDGIAEFQMIPRNLTA